mgnify:CR=1 FL=1
MAGAAVWVPASACGSPGDECFLAGTVVTKHGDGCIVQTAHGEWVCV